MCSNPQGRYAIEHAGITVMPVREGRRRGFDTEAEAEQWAAWNYRDRTSWKVITIERHSR